jgi:hypothetical protein
MALSQLASHHEQNHPQRFPLLEVIDSRGAILFLDLTRVLM